MALGARCQALCAATAVMFAASFAAACGGSGDGADDLPLPEGAALMEAAADRMETVESFHFVLEHEQGTSPITAGLLMRRAEGDSVAPDRLKAEVDALAPQLGNAAIKIMVVSVGDTSRMTNPFDRTRWMPVPGAALQELFDPAKGTVAALRAGTNHAVTGQETVRGVACWVVTADVDGLALKAFATVAEAGYTVKATLWIGREEPLVHRIRLAGEMGSKDTRGVIRVVNLSRFDEPVSIELPPE
jgi:hypothetical protein